MARCKFCGQEIDWITSLEGKQVPVDPDPVFVIEDGGPEAFLDDMGATITGRQATPEEERQDLPVAFAPTGGPARGQTNRPSAGRNGVAAMADLLQLPDRRYSVIYADPPWAYGQGGKSTTSVYRSKY